MEISPRLKTIYSLLPERCVLMDIGTDHCYLPIYALQNGKAIRAYAGDVRIGPLTAAKKNAAAYGFEKQITFLLSDGLDALSPTEQAQIDTFVFAGMGGMLIADLLRRAPFLKDSGKTLILQPMTAVYELKDYLREAGFATQAEAIACEGEKLYIIIKAVYDKASRISDNPFYYLRRQARFGDYLARQKTRFEAQKAGLLSSAHPDEMRLKEVERRLAQIKQAEQFNGKDNGNESM